MLKRSSDRKVANSVTPAGNSRINNAFGLPAGRAFSCPGATSVCEDTCYAGKIEDQYPAVFPMLKDNLDQLQAASFAGKVGLLHQMVKGFQAECERKNAEKLFRIHWDGDFYSREYASAWAFVIRLFPDIRFWVYTRSFTNRLNVIDLIADIPNLAVYLSVDSDNQEWAPEIIAEYPGIAIAALSDTMDESADVIRGIRGDSKPGAKCPELIGALPLISPEGSACVRCNLCPMGKADIRFAITTKGRK